MNCKEAIRQKEKQISELAKQFKFLNKEVIND